MDWPVTLPQAFIADSYTEEGCDYIIQTEMTNAVPMQRRTQTAAARPFGGKMILTLAQKEILSAFWRDHSASKINFPKPYTGASIKVRFTDRPKYVGLAADYLYVTLKFEEVQ